MPNAAGMLPVKRFSFKYNSSRVDMLPISAGMLPENWFCDRFKYVSFMPPNSGGMLPVSWFRSGMPDDTAKFSNSDMAASKGGSVPFKEAVTLFRYKANILIPSALR